MNNTLNGKTILLTGATGLIGTHFLYAFRDMYNDGIDLNVVAIGRSDPPYHLEGLLQMPFVKYRKINLVEEQLPAYFSNIDVIIHAASYGQPARFIKHATETIQLNTSVTIELLKRLSDDGKFLFLSSSEVCSGIYNLPIAEDMIGTTTPYHPRACYIESKRCGEAIINVCRDNGIDAKSIRLCLAYGDGTRKDDKRVINEFIQKAIVHGKIELMDGGQSIRTYCYAGDAVKMMLNILLKGRESVYNVGGDSTLNIAKLASMIGSIMEVPFILPNNERTLKGSPDTVNMSIRRYLNEFGDMDFVTMEDGLRKTIEYQKLLYGR